jgi:hypothetical protein
MVASSVWTKTRSIWNLPFDHPIEAGRGGRLATLGEVGQFILALPDALRQHESWQRATRTVLEAAKSGDTAPVARAVHMALILTGEKARLGADERARACDGHRTSRPQSNAPERDPVRSLASLTRDLAAARRHLQAVIGSVE